MHPTPVPPTPWTRRQIGAVAVAQVLGLAVAFVAFWMAVFTLSDEGFFATPQETGTRLWGVVFAVVTALSLPAGLWVAAGQRHERHAGYAAAAIAAAVLVLAAFYAAA